MAGPFGKSPSIRSSGERWILFGSLCPEMRLVSVFETAAAESDSLEHPTHLNGWRMGSADRTELLDSAAKDWPQ